MTIAVITPTVPAIRSAWRTRAGQLGAQAARFLRLVVAAAVTQVLASLATGGGALDHLDRKALVALLIPAVEVAWRQYHPAVTASDVPSAPGITAAGTDESGAAVTVPGFIGAGGSSLADGPSGLMDGA